MNQQRNNDNRVYNIQNIHFALIHSTVPGVLTLVVNDPIYVPSLEWEACLTRITELTSTKWVTKNKTTGTGTRVIYSQVYECHRKGYYTTQRTIRTGQKDSKKCGCKSRLKVTIWSSNPDVCEILLLNEHIKENGEIAHIPGDIEDRRTLPLTRATISNIEQQLRDGRNCRDIRISILRQYESMGNNSNDHTTGQRKVKYDDIYNMMNRLRNELFQFNENDMISTDIWLNERLVQDNYTIFNGDPSAYTNNSDVFSFGFLSPTQLAHLQSSRSICMDATYKITTQLNDIMYTIVTRDPYTGRGYPIAYMFTNLHSAAPICQWLYFLRDTCRMSIQQMTIDCSIPEVNAIQEVFPSVIIHYCAFHVIQAWNRNLNDKITLDESYTHLELQQYRNTMMDDLKAILREDDIDTMYNLIEQFKINYYDQYEFLDYFERYYAAEGIIQRWAYSFIDPGNRNMMTNNFIESWHNQRKVNYLKHIRNRRLDRLIFVLTHEAEFYFENERERILSNNGRMGPLENQQSRRRHEASLILVNEISSMIHNPEGESNSSPMIGIWTVRSFNPRVLHSTSIYNVIVNDSMLIESCSCPDFTNRHVPCKHIYLLKRFTNIPVLFETEQRNALDITVNSTHVQIGEVNDNSTNQIIQLENQDDLNENDNMDTINDIANNLQYISQSYTALHHDRHRVLNLSTITQEEAEQYAQTVRDLVLLHQTIIARHDHTRRSDDTQLQ